MPPYTIRRLARMRNHELLGVYLARALPGKSRSERYEICRAAAGASADALMTRILDAQ